MLNYWNLNDVEFEYLCQDIMQEKLGVVLHRFAPGRDGGIDLADDVNRKNIVVQVKHYINTPVPQLMAALSREVEKVKELAPKEYYICCSANLSPQKVNEIFQLFSQYMGSPANVITLNEIDDFLNDPANIEILKKHYKLWIESTGILNDIFNSDIFVDCETLLADIENQKKLFVQTSAFDSALKCLEKNKTLFITGNPGVGKTITSKMLVLYFAAMKYRVRFSTNTNDLGELKKSLSRNADIKEIILVDDCFGQAYFNMKESQNAELLALINYVNASPNKLLILNSRITIYQEAKERRLDLLKCFEGDKCKVFVLDMNAISFVEKAKIFYNHISFSGMGNEYFAEIKRNYRYNGIIKHPNYSPRIMEFICSPNQYKVVQPEDYYAFIMQQLNNPKEVWKDEYERRLTKVDRILLQTIYSLSDEIVSEDKVKNCFERRIACEASIDTTINQYEASLSRLLDGFVHHVYRHGEKMIAMINPSVNDYLDGRLIASKLEREQLISTAFSIQQKERLLGKDEFETFTRDVLKSHQIGEYQFDDESQKNAFIAVGIGKYHILDETYMINIWNFLNNPCPYKSYRNEIVCADDITKGILQKDICDYYCIKDFLNSECNYARMLYPFAFEEMVEVLCRIECYIAAEKREEFVSVASSQLQDVILEYCSDLDADDFSPDVEGAIEYARYNNGDYEGIDIACAIRDIEDEIISIVEEEIDEALESLPADIGYHHDYKKNIDYCIFGTEDIVNSYLDTYEDYDDDEHPIAHGDYQHSGSEIDRIFDRSLD